MSEWEFKINDPSLPAWLCLVVYLIAGAFGLRASRFSSTPNERTFWRGISLTCGLLALNKQLDIHSLVLKSFRTVAGGGHPGLTLLESLVLIVFCGLALWAAVSVLINLKRGTLKMRAAVGCLVLLGALLIARNTIPVMSAFLGWHLITEEQTLMHIHVSEVLELFFAGVIVYLAGSKQKDVRHVCGRDVVRPEPKVRCSRLCAGGKRFTGREVGLVRTLVAMILVAVWPAVTSHSLLESLGIIHVAHHDTDLTAKNAPEHHHQHPHHGEGPSHQDQQHHHQDSGGEGEKSADHHIFADGDYAWISAGKTLTKPGLLVCCSLSLFCASSLSAIEDDLDSPGPAPPGASPPLLQKTWQFSLRAAVPVRAPSTIS